MTFLEAINQIRTVLDSCGTQINVEDYDGIIVKMLASSNTLDEGRTTNQTHIAVTGEQMDIFPYLCSDSYFNGTGSNNDLKKFFVIKMPVTLFKSNLIYLDAEQNSRIVPNKIQTHTCVVRSKRENQADQMQVSMINMDGEEFVSFRKILHANSYLVVLKKAKVMEYDVFGVKAESPCSEELKAMNNKFFYLKNNSTVIGADSFEEREQQGNSTMESGENVLFYGVPGAGKSHAIKMIVGNAHYERVVFHPDFTYSDFVGQIMPRVKKNEDGDDKLTYEFVEGPFTKALKYAKNHPNEMSYLIVEEINRGNAPAIFGDIFQLLDRDDLGCSEYGITNYDVAMALALDDEEEIIKLPSNLTLLATMNTSDQNVFTLDTAFQRRWNMRHIKNEVEKAKHANELIVGSDVTWCVFANAINGTIVEYAAEMASSEDKQIGAYFVKHNELTPQSFPEKALKYLWDDAFKLDRTKVFDEEIKSIDDLIDGYSDAVLNNYDPIKRVMNDEVYKRMMDMTANSVEEAIDESEVFEAIESEGEDN